MSLLIWLVYRRLRRVRIGRPGLGLSNGEPPDITPRGRLVALSHSIRGLLTNQFGTAWRAKTTEELSAEPQLAELLGHDELQVLITFSEPGSRSTPSSRFQRCLHKPSSPVAQAKS